MAPCEPMAVVLGVPGDLVAPGSVDEWATKAGGWPVVSDGRTAAAVQAAAKCAICGGKLALVLQVRAKQTHIMHTTRVAPLQPPHVSSLRAGTRATQCSLQSLQACSSPCCMPSYKEHIFVLPRSFDLTQRIA